VRQAGPVAACIKRSTSAGQFYEPSSTKAVKLATAILRKRLHQPKQNGAWITNRSTYVIQVCLHANNFSVLIDNAFIGAVLGPKAFRKDGVGWVSNKAMFRKNKN
jgi:hypothetical protein